MYHYLIFFFDVLTGNVFVFVAIFLFYAIIMMLGAKAPNYYGLWLDIDGGTI